MKNDTSDWLVTLQHPTLSAKHATITTKLSVLIGQGYDYNAVSLAVINAFLAFTVIQPQREMITYRYSILCNLDY